MTFILCGVIMTKFEFKKYYESIPALEADMAQFKFVDIWSNKDRVSISHIDRDDVIIFNINKDGSLEFAGIDMIYN